MLLNLQPFKGDCDFRFWSLNNGSFGLESTNTLRSGIQFWETGVASGTGLLYQNVAVTDSQTGVSFTFDFFIDSANAQTGNITAAAGVQNGSLAENATLFEDGDAISFTVSNVVPTGPAGVTASFLGFVDVGSDFTGNNIGEGIIVNLGGTPTSFTRGNPTTPSTFGNDNDPRQGIHGGEIDTNVLANLSNLVFFDTNTTTTVETIGTSNAIRGISLGFETVIPEPSSMFVLFCLLGLGGFIRRRRCSN